MEDGDFASSGTSMPRGLKFLTAIYIYNILYSTFVIIISYTFKEFAVDHQNIFYDVSTGGFDVFMIIAGLFIFFYVALVFSIFLRLAWARKAMMFLSELKIFFAVMGLIGANFLSIIPFTIHLFILAYLVIDSGIREYFFVD